MRAYNWFLDPKQVIHQGGYLSDGFVILRPHVVNLSSAGITADGVYVLYASKRAVPQNDHRFKPGTERQLVSTYEEKTEAYRGRNGRLVEWTQWERSGARYGVIDGRLVAANARLVGRLLKAKYVIHAGGEETSLLILRKIGRYQARQCVGIIAPVRIDAPDTVQHAIVAEHQDHKYRQSAERMAAFRAGYLPCADPSQYLDELQASTSPGSGAALLIPTKLSA